MLASISKEEGWKFVAKLKSEIIIDFGSFIAVKKGQ